MSVGQRRHIVTVERKGTVRGSMGEEIETWTALTRKAWCKIVPGKGREAEESRRETGRVPTRFYTAYRTDITQAMRLRFGARLFEIVHVANIGEMNRELEILTVEVI